MPDDLPDLAARCEAADRPDRMLDGAIWEAIGLTEEKERHCRSWCQMDGRTDLTRDDFVLVWAPAFTGSIDAAMTLVPEGWGLHMLYEPLAAKGQEAVVWPPGVAMPTSAAKTLPLAICAAALRARDKEPGEGSAPAPLAGG